MGIWWNRVEHSNPFIDDPMLKEIVVPKDYFVFKTMDGALVGRQGTVLPSQFAGVKETKECTREIEVHSWNDGVEEEKATCEFEGIIRHTCKYCNQTKAEFTAALGHDFETEWTIDENEGIMYHVCKRDGCGAWSDLTPIPTATPTAKPTVPPTTKPTSTPVPSPSATQTATPTKAPINSKEQAVTRIADNAFKGDRKLTESCLEVRGFRKR